MSRPKYEMVSYQPPTAQVFGNASLPSFPSVGTSKPMPSGRPAPRTKLKDRLAIYENDDPTCQRLLCLVGVIFPPLWCLGAVLYLKTPETKTITRDIGFRNVVMSGVLGIFVIIFGLIHFVGRGQAAKTDPHVVSGSAIPEHGKIFRAVSSPSGEPHEEQLPRITWDFEHNPLSVQGWRNIIMDNARTNVEFRRQQVLGSDVVGPFPFLQKKKSSGGWDPSRSEEEELSWPESSAAAPVLFRSPPVSLIGNISLEVEFGAGGGPTVDMPAHPSTGAIAYGFMGVALGCRDSTGSSPHSSPPYMTWVHREVEDSSKAEMIPSANRFRSVTQRNSTVFSLGLHGLPMRNCTVDVIQHYTGHWSWFSVKSISILTEAMAASAAFQLHTLLPSVVLTASISFAVHFQ